jgi:hypothetical protein
MVELEGAGGTTQRTIVDIGQRFRCENRACGEYRATWVESRPGGPLLPEG